MTRTLTADLTLAFLTDYFGAGDLNTARDRTEFSAFKQLASGTGADQANRVYALKLTFTANETKVVNVKTANGGEDLLGQAVNLSAIKAIMIKNAGAQAYEVGGAETTPWLGFIDGATDLLNLLANGAIAAHAPSAGWAVGTDVNLQIKNLSAAAGEVHLIVVGVE
ncbi:MAG TPA: hypothetical protein PLU30_24590 [Verrucomicrobiae bacterium]|nr:hypothetical protein [Verrucomicrobiae bacterium]